MKRYLVMLLLFACSSVYSQSGINNYKYVIVPEKFGFQKETDQYSVNTLTKQLLESKGFTVYFDNADLPTEIANNKCTALSADVQDKGGFLTTKVQLTLKDCRGNTIFQSKLGTSREKEYNIGYNMALRDAFSSFDKVNYAYNGSNGKADAPASNTVAVAAVTTPAAATTVAVTTPANVVTEKPAAAVAVNAQEPALQGKALYAQAIPNGYQLIDTTPKKVLTILKTSAENYFIASNDTVSGIVLKINQDWFFEYYSSGKLVSEKLQIKF